MRKNVKKMVTMQITPNLINLSLDHDPVSTKFPLKMVHNLLKNLVNGQNQPTNILYLLAH